MAKYLDPKNDLIFKKIFGEHKDLLISFLNSFLPLGEREIVSIEYLSPEQVPKTELGKFSIVDVRCIDNTGRAFIVEMQNEWTDMFRKRLIINGAKAVIKQMDKKQITDLAKLYSEMEPVYVLAVVNDEFTDRDRKEWHHHLKVVDIKNPELILEGLDYILLELPKFKPETWTLAEKQMAILWLRFLREIEKYNKDVPEEFSSNEYIQRAIELCEEAGLSPEEKERYERVQEEILWQKNIKYYEVRDEKNNKIIEEKDKTIEEKDKTIEEKDRTIEEKNKIIEEKEREIELLKRLYEDKKI